jgi:DNA-directed RNA polymerase subunit RPC12/RpoP
MPAAARMNCYGCGEAVAVNINRSNRAYYHCGHCGLSVMSKRSESTERMLNMPLTKNVVPAKEAPHELTPKPTHAKPAISTQPAVDKPATVAQPAAKSAFRTLMDVQ